MGVVLGSGYSQVPLVLESALAKFEIMRAMEVIKAQRGDRGKPMLEVVKDRQMMFGNSGGKYGNRESQTF